MKTRIKPGYRRPLQHVMGQLARTAALAIALGCPHSARCLTVASGSLDLQNMGVTATPGSITWGGTWSLTTVSSVYSTDGGPAANLQTGSLSSSASASVLYASANSSASAPALDASGLLGHVDGQVNLPGGFSELATVGDSGNFSSLETSFTVNVPSVTVSFSSTILSALSASADLSGTVLLSDTIFNVNVDGSPVLSFADSVSAGPGQSASSTPPPTVLNASMDLTSGTHDLYIELDTEQQAYTSPDAGSTGLLLLACLGLIMFSRRVISGRNTLAL